MTVHTNVHNLLITNWPNCVRSPGSWNCVLIFSTWRATIHIRSSNFPLTDHSIIWVLVRGGETLSLGVSLAWRMGWRHNLLFFFGKRRTTSSSPQKMSQKISSSSCKFVHKSLNASDDSVGGRTVCGACLPLTISSHRNWMQSKKREWNALMSSECSRVRTYRDLVWGCLIYSRFAHGKNMCERYCTRELVTMRIH